MDLAHRVRLYVGLFNSVFGGHIQRSQASRLLARCRIFPRCSHALSRAGFDTRSSPLLVLTYVFVPTLLFH